MSEETWKVVNIDNYDREFVSDQIVKDGLTKQDAEDMAEAMNNKTHHLSEDYFIARPSSRTDYKYNP